MRRSLFLVALSLPSAASAGAASGPHTLCQVAPGDDLAAVVSRATSGDTLLLSGGTHAACVVVPADLDIAFIGDSSGTTTIDCAGAAEYAIEVFGVARLDRVNLLNAGDHALYVNGGALTASNMYVADFNSISGEAIGTLNGTLTLTDVVIENVSSTTDGGAITALNSTTVLNRVTIKGASTTGRGGAIWLSGGSLTAADSTFTNNYADGTGGVIGADPAASSTVTILNSTLSYNTAKGGGALLLPNGALHISGSSFNGNTALTGYGGSIVAWADTTVTVHGSTFQNNVAGADGGAASFGGRAELAGNTFTANESLAGVGGAVRSNIGPVYASNNTYDSNVSAGRGGAVASITEWHSFGETYVANTSSDAGGAVSSSGMINVYGTQFTGNRATGDGGAIGSAGGTSFTGVGLTFSDNTTTGVGGAIGLNKGNVQCSACTFTGNSAAMGGAIGVGAAGTGDIWLDNAIGQDNTADQAGGFLWSQGFGVYISGGVFTKNVVSSGDGGFAFASERRLDIANARVANNSALARGGAVATVGSAQLMLRHSILCGNQAAQGGAMYSALTGSASSVVESVVFQENSAVQAGAAVLLQGLTASPQPVLDYTFANVTFAGNHPGTDGSTFRRLLGNNPYFPTHVTNAIFAENGTSAHADLVPDATGKALNFSGWFSGPAKHLLDGPNAVNEGELVATGPLLPGWSFDADCTNDSFFEAPEAKLFGAAWAPGQTPGMFEDADQDGYAAAFGDCDDANPNISPAAVEIAGDPDGFDEDCASGPDYDADGDGYFPVSANTANFPDAGLDCDASNADIHPLGIDHPLNGVDDDCFLGDLLDSDHDGAIDASDCEPLNPLIYPGAPEFPHDGVDTNCDATDEDDADGDGSVWIGMGGDDCDDLHPDAYPGAPEVWYDGVDQDCAGDSDFDQDGDGFDAVEGGGDDCDDTDAEVSPGAAELWYDGVDQNCAGDSDFDQDGDGFDATEGGGDDCDDTAATVHLGAPEIADGLDNNCDGTTDPDADQDGVLDQQEIDVGLDPFNADSDGDGLSDGEEWPDPTAGIPDSDGDGIADFLERDADADGVEDGDEGVADFDGDGLPNFQDDDDDNDGIPTIVEAAAALIDADDDGSPNYLDSDSDNDGALDAAESATDDADGDGLVDYLDAIWSAPPAPEPSTPALGCSSTRTSPAWLALLGLVALRRKRA